MVASRPQQSKSTNGTKQRQQPRQQFAELDYDSQDDDSHETRGGLSDKKGNQKAKGSQKSSKNGMPSPPQKKDRMSVHKRLNLFFPVSRIGRYLRGMNSKYRISRTAPVFIAAVLDYMMGELILMASEAATNNKKSTMKPRHIQCAIRDDEEFLRLLGHVTIAHGGRGGKVDIHPCLTSSKGAKKKSNQSEGEREKRAAVAASDSDGEYDVQNEDGEMKQRLENKEIMPTSVSDTDQNEDEDMKQSQDTKEFLSTSDSGGDYDEQTEDEEEDVEESEKNEDASDSGRENDEQKEVEEGDMEESEKNEEASDSGGEYDEQTEDEEEDVEESQEFG